MDNREPDVVAYAPGHPVSRVGDISVAVPDFLFNFFTDSGGYRRRQRFLVREVIIKAALGYTRGLNNLVDRDGVNGILPKKVGTSADKRGPDLPTLLRTDADGTAPVRGLQGP
jgi:hypothetical protein